MGSNSVVITAVPNHRNPSSNHMGSQFSVSRFMKFVFRISGSIKFRDLSGGVEHWWPEFDYR